MLKVLLVVLICLVWKYLSLATNYVILQQPIKDVKVARLTNGNIAIVFIDDLNPANSFLEIYDSNMDVQIAKTAIATTAFNSKWNMMELSSNQLMIAEGSNLHFITTNDGSITSQASLNFNTDAPFLSMTPGIGFFYIIKIQSNSGTVYKLINDGTDTTITYISISSKNNVADCTAFRNNYLGCISSNQNSVSYRLLNDDLESKDNNQLGAIVSDKQVTGIKTILVDSVNDLLLSVTMKEKDGKGYLYAVILQKSGDTLVQVSPSSNDLEISSDCNKNRAELIFLNKFSSDKFIVSCQRNGYTFDFVSSIVQYDINVKTMIIVSRDSATNCEGFINYYNYFYINVDSIFIYLTNLEIRYQFKGAPVCIKYDVLPAVKKNQVGSLDFTNYYAKGLDDNGEVKIRFTLMNFDLQITRASNPINLNEDYSVSGFGFNSGNSLGTITYKFQVVASNRKTSKICDIVFIVEGCHIACKSCSDSSNDEADTKCESCDTENFYYPLKEKPAQCYHKDKVLPKYVLFNENWEKCFDNCLLCTGMGTYENMKCIIGECEAGYLPLEKDETFCYASAPIRHYKNTILNKFSECNISCFQCSNANQCDICDTSNGFYRVFNQIECINEETKVMSYPNYYLNKDISQYEPCYIVCQTCEEFGSSTNHKCITCKAGTIPNPVKPTDCVTKCDQTNFNWYIDNLNYKCTSEKICPNTHPKYVSDSNQCVKSCLPTDDCIICKTKTLFQYENQCVTVCPLGTQPIDETRTCSKEDKCVKKESNTQMTPEEFSKSSKKIAQNYATTYASTDKQVNFIFNDKYSVVIYKNEDCAKQFETNISQLDFEKCLVLLRNEYKIPEPIPIITVKMDLFRTNQPNQVAYEFYSSSGQFLDLAPCRNETVIVTVDITHTEGVNLTQAKEFEKIGVDVYNSSDPFFNYICFNYTSSDGTDVPLVDRKKNYYQNASLCEDGCTYSGSNLTLKEASCECEIKTSFITDLLDNPLTGELLELFNNANFEVLQCYKEVFTTKYFLRNIGGWIILSLILLQLAFLITYIAEGLIPLKDYLLQYIKVNPPKKNIDKSIDEKEEEYDEVAQSPSPLAIKDKTYSKPVTNNFQLNFLNEEEKKKEKQIKENDQMLAKISTFKDKQPMLYSNNRLNTSSKDLDMTKKPSQLEIQNQMNNEHDEMTDPELDELMFEDAVEYDKRTFCTIYCVAIKDKQSIFYTFCNNSPLESCSIKAMCFFYGIALYFTFNAVFYSESYISAQFESGESFNFLNMIKNELSRCIYSTLVGFFVGLVLGCLSSQKYRIEILVKRVKDPDKFRHEALAILKSTRIRNIVFIVINFVTILLYWYFVSAFCFCYSNTQVSWLIGGLVTWGITLIFPFIICFMIAGLRIMGIKCKLR